MSTGTSQKTYQLNLDYTDKSTTFEVDYQMFIK